MSEAMDAEFDTVAVWTAEAAIDLGPDFHEPAGCRGSGSPPALDWLIDRLNPTSRTRMLDCGAGVGGPAAYVERRRGVVPILSDPEAGACRAAVRLFDATAVQAATDLPFRDHTFDIAWSLGVLCTVPGIDQARFLRELRRVLRPGGRLGLLVFVRGDRDLSEQPDGNTFPTDRRLLDLLERAGFTIEDKRDDDVGTPSDDWTQRTETVGHELARRHGDNPTWQTAATQSAIMGRLLERREITGRLAVVA